MKLDNIHVASLKSFKSFLAIVKLFGRVHTRQALAGGDDAFCSNFSLIIGNTPWTRSTYICMYVHILMKLYVTSCRTRIIPFFHGSIDKRQQSTIPEIHYLHKILFIKINLKHVLNSINCRKQFRSKTKLIFNVAENNQTITRTEDELFSSSKSKFSPFSRARTSA